ncbi:MAG TPA: aminopeptidase P family protein [Blastocatellia bacterium]|nr:aminopeptidase P family protein [Blastocatellia bacterium]
MKSNSAQHTFKLAIIALIAATLLVPAFAGGNDKLANIPKPEYSARRQKLLAQIKDGIVVMVGAREEDFGEVGRFRQRNDFMYLTGVQTPAAYLIFVPAGVISGHQKRETVFIPDRNVKHEQWTGVQIGPGPEGERLFGLQEVAASTAFKERLNQLLTQPAVDKPLPKIYTVIPAGPGSDITRESRFVEMLRQNYPKNPIVDVSKIVGEMRKVKSPAEIELLQKAVDVSNEGHREIARAIKPGAYEYEAQAALEAAWTRLGAERPGYPSIVGSGINGTILHYNENRKRIDAGDLVVVDAAAEYSYYTADITRTFPASGKFTPRQREVYQLVLDAQRAAEKAFVPGKSSLNDLQRAAKKVMESSPLRDKQGNTLDKYFIHGLGHWIGMDVHDVGNYGVLPVGSVFTIEPGIYLPDEGFGVRIEDDYLVTDKGLVKMSAKLPSEPDEIERMMLQERTAAPQR